MSELLTMAWVDVAEKVKTADLALVPVGAVEVYGPHMPQGTDGIVAAALCRSLAERVDCVVAPLVPVGYSAALQDFPGTLSVPPHAVMEYCRGIAESLFKFGIRRILYINGHAGNVPAINEVCQELTGEGRRLAQIDIWRYIQSFASPLLDSTEHVYGHAGEAMTSVMLHLMPDDVRMSRAINGAPGAALPPLGLSQPRSYREAAPQGLIGDATLSTAEKGKQIYQGTVDRLEEFICGSEFSLT